MRRLSLALPLVLVVALAAVVAGCGGADPDAAKTPADAVTITNGQVPTDDGGGEGGEGDVEAGRATFETSCQSCHLAGGAEAGPGPVLVDRGLAAEAIRTQIVSPAGTMPANLVSGADLDNVVAFVASLQGESTDGSSGAGGGDDTAAIDAGKAFFETTCQGCHTNGGTEQGVGPVLAGKSLTEDVVRTTVAEGRGAMPPGLASGDDLENVVKFVLSLQ